jgi:hypothetical protein
MDAPIGFKIIPPLDDILPHAVAHGGNRSGQVPGCVYLTERYIRMDLTQKLPVLGQELDGIDSPFIIAQPAKIHRSGFFG